MPDNISPKENFINERPQSNLQRVGMDAFGVGLFGVGRYSSQDRTKNAWVRATATVTALLLGLLIGSAMSVYADTFTTNLNLRKPDVNVIDPVTPWGTKLNNNADILDLAVCDKRIGCTIIGAVTLSGQLILSNTSFLLTGPNGFIISESSITASAFFGDGSGVTNISGAGIVFPGGFINQGTKTNIEIQALTCAPGKGACAVYSSDEGDMYTSTGTLAGQYRNARTGKGP